MIPWLFACFVVLVAVFVALRLRERARRRRAEKEHLANKQRLQAAARDLDRKVSASLDGGPQYGARV